MGKSTHPSIHTLIVLALLCPCVSSFSHYFTLGKCGPVRTRHLNGVAGLKAAATIEGQDLESAPSARLVKARQRLQSVTSDDGSSIRRDYIDQRTGLRKVSRVMELVVKVAEPEIQYDPDLAEEKLFKKPIKWLTRNVQLFVPLTLFIGTVLADIQTGKEVERRRERAQQLLGILANLGPAIIKGGQALASRPDLLPSEYLEELQKLQDRVPPFDNSLAFQTIEQELGRPFDEVFELVQEDPIAAASIGQVYKARLKANGAEVALKVQRPGCEEIISLDLYVLRWYSQLLNKVLTFLNRDISLVSIIDDFGELIYREIDYLAEAANAQRFTELYAGVTDVFVPKVYPDLSTKKVLTMEWVDGAKLTESDLIDQYGLDSGKLVDILVQCSLRQMLENGFFHADPHAGNLLACEDGRLCYLDFGMMSYVEKHQRYGIIEAIIHLVNRDFVSLVVLYERLGFIPRGLDTQPIVRALENALPDVLDASVGELNFKNVINKLGDIMYEFPFSLPPYYIAIIRCLGVLEGLAIQIDSEFRIIKDAYPYIASRLLTDSAPELQSALQTLLFKDGEARWERMEELLVEAQDTRDYDVTLAINQMVDYLLSEQGEPIVDQLSVQLVDVVDRLGVETVTYLLGTAQGLQRTIQGLEDMDQRELSPTMQSFTRIVSTLSNSEGFELEKIVPLMRRLLREPKVQELSVEMASRLSERAISRTVRAVFQLPQPTFLPSNN
eukprot:CAMPEP_0113934326 /NCGR_PEP_ID=MMETSP1339-20121228/1653_1 /TAXON_ID=94617 /ORGANISM="Fibrocapsa japonica" /LENGTH=726 /DNA_ID=CAMNT_0000936077 /DNA_START=52 /DNA_END=2232 /DNA_ORIENTATION=+ /assembly_acc=CAM_ASM_000762